jgi:predicted DsbA family dithiol-disulfide isomerase
MSHFRLSLLSLISVFCAATCVAQSPAASKAKQPVATVDGQAIYEEDLAAASEGQLATLRTQEYEIKKKALDTLIDQKLLEAAAKKKGLTTDQLLNQEVNSKVADPSDDEVAGYYFGLRDRIKSPFESVKAALRANLKDSKIREAREVYLKSLRATSNLAIMISPPRVQVAFDPARMRGNPTAPITIVEFSDYQCPYCHAVEPTVKQVLAKYGDKVLLSYRDFPLTAIHDHAEIAAEASRCALEQGKFWEYHDVLFTASNLDKDALIGYARDLKLDDKQFASCLTSEKYKADIAKDVEDGRKVGISGTPGFFINGIEISGSQPQDAFSRIIDDELARKRSAQASVSIKAVPVKP